MKKFTKILSLVLAVSLIASLFTVNVMAASTAHTVTVKLYDSVDVGTRNEITTAEVGDTVVVELTMDNTEKLASCGYIATYSSDAFAADTAKTNRVENCINKAWLDGIKDTDGDWGYYLGSPTYNVGVAGELNFNWAGSEGVEADYAMDNRVIGLFLLTVKDGANGAYTFTLTGTTGDAGENTKASMVVVPATLTVGTVVPDPTTYDITFKVAGQDDVVVSTVEGEVPVAPQVADYEDDDYTYTFTGWDKDIVAATEATTYTAVFDAVAKTKYYNVKFYNEDGSEELKSYDAEENIAPSAPEAPEKAATATHTYVFAGWATEIGGEALASLPAVTGEATYYAVYTATPITYVIKFVVEGETVQEGPVNAGDTPAYTGETPTKAEDENYTYEFAGWDPEISAVTGEATYTAKFTSVLKPAGVGVAGGALDGVTGTSGVKYDNAYKTVASFSRIGGATEVGVLFIPDFVLTNGGNWDLAAKAGKVSDVVGNGAVTLNAAIIKIPARFSGQDLKMWVKPYYVMDDEVIEGDADDVTINFTKQYNDPVEP